MSEDFEIELLDENEEEASDIQLPMNILLFGEVESDDIKVYIKQDVYKALEKYAVADVEHERGTIILGDYTEALGKRHVIISNYIEAKYTDASASTLTFTHKTWDYVHKTHDSKYKDKKIVGWQHTHPGYGIFLSNYDLFIHENFFNLPFQIAYVIDPVQNIRGFFQWKNDKIEKLKGYYIYDDVGKTIKIESPKRKVEEKEKEEKPAKSNKLLSVLVALLIVATTILAISNISLRSLYNKQQSEQNKMQETITKQDEIAKQQSETIEKIKAQNDNGEGSDEEIKYIKYTVAPGDTLLKICEEKGIDYYQSVRLIMSLNAIDNPSEIYVGQKLILPLINND